MDLDMTVRTVRVLRVQVMLRTGRFLCSHTMRHAVTGQTKLCDAARDQHTRIRRTVRCMTSNATIGLYWSMLVNKRSLLVCVTLDTGCVSAGCEPRLLELETAVRIVAIAALHGAFEHPVVKWLTELSLGFVVAGYAELGLICSQHPFGCLTGILCGGVADYRHRTCAEVTEVGAVCRMTLRTSDIVPPMLAAAKIIVRLFAGMTRKARFRCGLRIHAFERNYLRLVTPAFDVRLAGAVT